MYIVKGGGGGNLDKIQKNSSFFFVSPSLVMIMIVNFEYIWLTHAGQEGGGVGRGSKESL